MKTIDAKADELLGPEVWARVRGLTGPVFQAFDLDAMLKEISEAAARMTGAEAASLLLLSGRGLFFRTVMGEKEKILRSHKVPVDRGLAGWVASHGKSALVNDVSKDERFDGRMDQVTGFTTRSVLAVPLRAGDELLGVCEVVNKKGGLPFTRADEQTLSYFGDLAASLIVRERQAEDQRNFFTHAVEILTTAIEAARPGHRGRSARVAKRACAVGRRLGIDGEDYRDLYYAALLHDVGVIVAPAGRGHTDLGAALFKDVRLMNGVSPLIRHHRERWDGAGSPDGLKGDEIPLGARVIALAEALELASLRELPPAEAAGRRQEIARQGAGGRFDPKVVEAYLEGDGE